MKSLFPILCAAGLLFSRPLLSKSSTPLDLISVASKRTVLKTPGKSSAALVVLDPGHGGIDKGAVKGSLPEKKITLLTALYTKKRLEELGYRVLLTRTKDHYISLPKRVSLANRSKSAVFASIHCNAAQNSEAKGLEIYYSKSGEPDRGVASAKMADSSLLHIVKETGCASRGVKSGRFYVIRETEMPSILIEIGFLTNREDWQRMRNKSYLEKVAKGIADGIDSYVRSERTGKSAAVQPKAKCPRRELNARPVT